MPIPLPTPRYNMFNRFIQQIAATESGARFWSQVLHRVDWVVGELTPRLSGYAPDEVEYGFGLEKRVGGHAFALTFTNTFGTTFAQMARGGTASSLYLGFNLGRKFY